MDILLNSTGIVNLRTASAITTGSLYVRRDGTGDYLRVSANADMSAYTNLQSNVEQVFTGDVYALGWGKLSVSSTTNKYSAHTAVQPVYYGAASGLTAGGVALNVGATALPSPGILDIMPVSNAAIWAADKTPALIVEVDPTVLYEGRPTIKITIPAGTAGGLKVGTNVADALLPYLWDGNDFGIAVRYSGFTGYNMTSTFPPAIQPFISDATYANFWAYSNYNMANVPEQKPQQDEWQTLKYKVASRSVGGGSPITVLGDGTYITAAKARCKLQWTQVAQATDCYIWVGMFGKLPKRKKPTIIWTLDDGFATWSSDLAPLFKHFDMPVSMAIVSNLVGTGKYMYAAQIKALYDDPSRLFDITNHTSTHQTYDQVGAVEYYKIVEDCRKYLQSIGIKGDGPYHLPYPQSVWGNDLKALLEAGGYLSARGSNFGTASHYMDQVISSDKLRWHLNVELPLIGTKTLAQANAAIDTIVASGGFGMINGHEFVAANPTTYQWTFSDMAQLVARVAALRDAGVLEVKSHSKWYADLTGRECDRR